MNKINIIISIIAVLLLTLVSFTNVVGYNTIKTSQEEIIASKYSFDECKDYLFETLVEISENPEIKDIIKSNYKPQRNTLLPFRRNNVELKVKHLELLYNLGLKIMNRLGEERVEELMENIEIPEYVDELDAIIMGNDKLKDRIYTLNEMNSEEISTTDEPYKLFICAILFIIFCAVWFIVCIPSFVLLFIGVRIFGDEFWNSILFLIIFSIPTILSIIITFPVWILIFYFDCLNFPHAP